MAAISDLYIELLNWFYSAAIAGDIYRRNIVNTGVTFAIVMVRITLYDLSQGLYYLNRKTSCIKSHEVS